MALLVATGSYVGDGGTSGTRTITGIGFTPKAVFVLNDSSLNTESLYTNPHFATNTSIASLGSCIGFLGENGWLTNASYDTFQSFNSDGFIIQKGTNSTRNLLNKSGTTFSYIAIGGDEAVTGSYAGNGADNRSITGVGFQPSFVFMMGGAQYSVMKFRGSGEYVDSASYTYNAADVTNTIQSLDTDGFQVGMDVQVNASGTTYHYLAIKNGDFFNSFQYVGNSADNRNIDGLDFQPSFVLIKSSSTQNFVIRSNQNSGDSSKVYRSLGYQANNIQGFNTDGFQVGTSADVNSNGTLYRYIAFRNNNAITASVADELRITEVDSLNGFTWLRGYLYRNKVTITGTSGAGTNYQVLLTVGASAGGNFNLGGLANYFPANGTEDTSGDLRFTASDGETLLPFWVESVTGGVARIWVKVGESLDSNKDIYIYYGGQTAAHGGNVSHGDNTFILFDGFNGSSVDSNKWTVKFGSPTVSGGTLNLGISGGIESINSFQGPIAWGFRINRTGATDTATSLQPSPNPSGLNVNFGNTSYSGLGVYTWGGGAFSLSQITHGDNVVANRWYLGQLYSNSLKWNQEVAGTGTRTLGGNVRNYKYKLEISGGDSLYPGNPMLYIFIKKQTDSGTEPAWSSTSARETTFQRDTFSTLTLTDLGDPDNLNDIQRGNVSYVSAASAASHSFSFEVSNKQNRILLVWSIDRLSSANSQITSMNYNGDALSFVQEFETAKANFGHGAELWVLYNPDPGVNTFTINYSPNQDTALWIVEYNGVKQSDFATINSGYQFNSGTSVSANITTTQPQQWVVTPAILNRAFSSGTNFTRPLTPSNNMQFGDTNGPVSVGALTVTVTQATAPNLGIYSFILEPIYPVTAIMANVFDELIFNELLQNENNTFIDVFDLQSILESQSLLNEFFTSAFDLVNTTEQTNQENNLFSSINDILVTSENVNASQFISYDLDLSVFDPVTLNESIISLVELWTSILEDVIITEANQDEVSVDIEVVSDISTNEDLAIIKFYVIDVNDSITFTESNTTFVYTTSSQLPLNRASGRVNRLNMKWGGRI